VPDFAWNRTARRDDEVVTARDLLDDALHEAYHHAHDASAVSGTATAGPLLLSAG